MKLFPNDGDQSPNAANYRRLELDVYSILLLLVEKFPFFQLNILTKFIQVNPRQLYIDDVI
jgi:hypothetical protein